MKKKWISVLLAVFFLMGGCGESPAEETAATQPAVTDETSATENPTESAAETTAQLVETDVPTESIAVTEPVTEAPTQPPETAEPTQPPAEENVIENEEVPVETESVQTEELFHPDMQLFDAPTYACQIEVPAGWAAYEGVSDGTISSEISVFQPETPNGDSIALMVEDAEDPDVFASMTEDDLAEAYAQSLSSVSMATLEPITLWNSPGYRMSVEGEVSGMTVVITQLFLNCTDSAYGNHLYALTYTNTSGEEPVYTDFIESYFHLT